MRLVTLYNKVKHDFHDLLVQLFLSNQLKSKICLKVCIQISFLLL